MNHDAARQRESDKRWDYTSENDGRVHATGYCAGVAHCKTCGTETFYEPGKGFTRCTSKDGQHDGEHLDRAPYHTTGHATAEEACACYRVYLLDTQLRLYDPKDAPKPPTTLHRCQAPDGCPEFTAGLAEVGNGDHWRLCDAHRTRETVEKLFREVGEAWTS